MAILFFVLSAFLIIAKLGSAGVVGNFIYNIFEKLIGIGYYLIPITFLLIGITLIQKEKEEYHTVKIVSSILFFFFSLP